MTRGLAAPRLIVADGAPGRISALEELWPRADRQHCCVHRLRNLLAKLPKDEQDRVRFNYWAALTDATSVNDGKLRLQILISELEHRGYESAARCLAEDLDALVVHLRYPLRHRERWRSTDESVKGRGSISWVCASCLSVLVAEVGVCRVSLAGRDVGETRSGWVSAECGPCEILAPGGALLAGGGVGVRLRSGRGRPPSEAQVLGLMPAAQLAPLRAFSVA